MTTTVTSTDRDPTPTSTRAAAVLEAAAAPPAAPALPDIDNASTAARIGRLIFFPSAVMAIGVLAFVAFAYVGRRHEIDTLMRLLSLLGVGVGLGGLIEVVGLKTLFGGFDGLLDENAGRAALARSIGGAMLVIGFLHRGAGDSTPRSKRSLSAAMVDDDTELPPEDTFVDTDPWRPVGHEWVGLIGIFVVLFSFAFDGHTLSEGPRLLHALLSIVHVTSAGIWAGGVLALAVVLRRRHNDRVDSNSIEMTLKFSVIAMFSLALAGFAGVVMALFIDSDVLSYVSTDWGRVLIVKVLFVAAAAALGSYNHFNVVPGLESAPNDPVIIEQARNTITTEAVVLVIVALASAILVGASTL